MYVFSRGDTSLCNHNTPINSNKFTIHLSLKTNEAGICFYLGKNKEMEIVFCILKSPLVSIISSALHLC